MVALENNESSTEQSSVHLTAEPIGDECPQCRHRRETYSAIGLAVFSVSLLSCGILMPLSIVVAIIIQSLIAIGCKDCRRRRFNLNRIVRGIFKK